MQPIYKKPIAAPATPIISLAQAKAHLLVFDDLADTRIAGIIGMAIELVQERLGKLINQYEVDYYYTDYDGSLELDDEGALIDSVAYINKSNVSIPIPSTKYFEDTARRYPRVIFNKGERFDTSTTLENVYIVTGTIEPKLGEEFAIRGAILLVIADIYNEFPRNEVAINNLLGPFTRISI